MSKIKNDEGDGLSPGLYLGLNNPYTGQPILSKPLGIEVGSLRGDTVFNKHGFEIGSVDRDRGIFYERLGSESVARPLGPRPGPLGSSGPLGGSGSLGR